MYILVIETHIWLPNLMITKVQFHKVTIILCIPHQSRVKPHLQQHTQELWIFCFGSNGAEGNILYCTSIVMQKPSTCENPILNSNFTTRVQGCDKRDTFVWIITFLFTFILDLTAEHYIVCLTVVNTLLVIRFSSLEKNVTTQTCAIVHNLQGLFSLSAHTILTQALRLMTWVCSSMVIPLGKISNKTVVVPLWLRWGRESLS